MFFIILHISYIQLSNPALFVVFCKLYRSARNRSPSFNTNRRTSLTSTLLVMTRNFENRLLVNLTFCSAFGVCYTNQEIGGCLAVGGLVSHIDKILPCFGGWAEVRHTTFINDAYLVEDVVESLSSLID